MGHREALLQGARQCLEQKGYARTTARDIVGVSGTNLASIGYHFGSKEALLNEAIGLAFQEWTEHVGEIVLADPGATPLERMARTWGAALESFGAHRHLIVAFVEALAQAERSPELRAQLAGHYQRIRERAAELVRASLGPGADGAEDLASFSIAVIDGLLLQWLLDPQAAPDGERLSAALAGVLAASAASPPDRVPSR